MPLPIRLFLAAALAVLGSLAQSATVLAQAGSPNPLVVMNLAAHPDDEDGSTLAYYRWAKNAVAYSVIYTRGEGGQNEAGPDLYERLGAIRTQETEMAARILGTQVYVLNFYDFGFSKHAHEAFSEWSRPRTGFWDTDTPPVGTEAGRDSVTARIVYLVRKLKPDVMFTNHDTTTAWPNAQHGQHQAVGISAYDAFALAADPTYHPEHLAQDGVDLWQPKRLFLRQWQGDGTHDVAVPVEDSCPTGRPLQVAEACTDLAVRAAQQHVSQGFDKFAHRFRRDTTYFKLLRAAPGVPPLPDGANDLAVGLTPNPNAASASATYLLDSRRRSFPLRVDADPAVAVPGQTVSLSWPRPAHRPGTTERLRYPTLDIVGPTDTQRVASDAGFARLTIAPDVRPTLPLHRAQYDRYLDHPAYRVQREDGPLGYIDLAIAPPVTVDLNPSPIRLVPGENVLSVRVQTYDPEAESVLAHLMVIADEADDLVHTDLVSLTPTDTLTTFRFSLPDDIAPGRYRVAVQAVTDPESASMDAFMRLTNNRAYGEVRPAAVLPDVSVAEGLRVGFVRSYDQTTENALRAMGAAVTVLDSTALATADFDAFDTVVLDIRAYLVRGDLRAHNDRLLEWVRRGGHLVVGYHKTFEWNPGGSSIIGEAGSVPDGGWAPLPLTLGRERVTYEDAPVTVLAPDHVLFQTPHAIGPSDWDGWVQERGLYFPMEYDDAYQELVAMSDPGEDPLTGSLLVADVGDGTYLYSALGWYRQLEALNPGAWRLFANLVSLPLTDER